jgi:hypothetical protein
MTAPDAVPTPESPSDAPDPADQARIDRLLDAIDLIKEGRAREAQGILRELIGEDANFEDAWLWMSVTVETLDQASLCLDNVLRINPRNYAAAGALYRIRIPEMELERRRARLHFWRDMAVFFFWLLTLGSLYAVFATYSMVGR